MLGLGLAGPWLLGCAVVLAPIGEMRARGLGAAGLVGLLLGLDVVYEVWIPVKMHVASSSWQILRLGAVVPAVALAPWLAGRGRPVLWLGRAMLAGAVLVVLAGLAVCLSGAAGGGTHARADAAVVLGFALTPDGRATPSLVARVRHAAGLVRRGDVRTVVLTGGPRDEGGPAEATVADGIARRAGVPADRLLREERSATTWENMLEAARIVRRMRWRSVLVVTEPHHMGRAMVLARAAGLPARPSVSSSPLWSLRAAPYWVVREVAYMPTSFRHAVLGAPRPARRDAPELELVESAPVETSLDHADLRDAFAVWPERIARARRTIDVAEFYASSRPGSRLEASIAALEAAADRGVRVRFLADASFARLYPETLARLDDRRRIEVRRFDGERVGLGGIHHAKYFVIDGEEAVLGSHNFDWRSLTHIQELGVRVRDRGVARALTDLFEMDWALARDARPTRRSTPPDHGLPDGVTVVASPRGWLPDESLWDLPHLVAWIDGARRSVRLQLLTFGDDEGRWPVLGAALHRAADRGVRVQVLVADWALRPRTRAALARLHAPPRLAVKVVSIPEARAGFVPFARVVHAKYMTVDGARAWIGTSNGEREYFVESRNVGLLVERRAVARRLDAFFDGVWSSEYARGFDPDAAPPRIAE